MVGSKLLGIFFFVFRMGKYVYFGSEDFRELNSEVPQTTTAAFVSTLRELGVFNVRVPYSPRIATFFPGPAPSLTSGLYTEQVSRAVLQSITFTLTRKASTEHGGRYLARDSRWNLESKVFVDSARKPHRCSRQHVSQTNTTSCFRWRAAI